MTNKTVSNSMRRMAARLAAVQALYDIEMTTHAVPDVIATFTARGGTATLEGEEIEADPQLLADIVRGVASEQAELDAKISTAGRAKRDVSRYESVLRAILRAGAYELWRHPQFDAPLLISQYLTITDSFYDRTEIGLVNAVLDSLAKSLRAQGGAGGPQAPSADPLETPIGDDPA